MAACSGSSSGSSNQLPSSSGSEETLRAAMEQKKRKRMLSNRESARRSRLRKQKHQDDLTAQAGRLEQDNGQILAILNLRAQSFLAVEAENSVLRTQLLELTARLSYLHEVLQYMNLHRADGGEPQPMLSEPFLNPWSAPGFGQPIMASSDTVHHY